MTSFRSLRLLPLAALSLAFALAPLAHAQKQPAKKKDANKAAKKAPKPHDPAGLLKPGPRPQKAPLPASTLPLEFVAGERIALFGSASFERMSLFGNFEALLHLKHADKQLVVRNFSRPAEEVGVHQRSGDYTLLDDPLYAFNPDTFICQFGFNESFKGPAGVEDFKKTYGKFLDDYSKKYRRDDAGSPPRFVLVSPLAVESSGDPLLPDAAAQNANIELYAAAVKAVAAERKLAFLDVFAPSKALFEREPGLQYTINGCHQNIAGDAALAAALDAGLFGAATARGDSQKFEKLRAAVVDKAWHHNQDHRMINGWYVYGGRRTYDTETFPREYVKLRNMVAVRDAYVHDIAAGKPVADKPDDSKTGELIVPPTRFGSPGRDYSENKELKYQTPDEFIKTVQVPPGFEIKLFADEAKFPEIAKPVQMNFDNKGRLWVSCMPSYPQWRPGDPPPSDKLVILEDTNGDGAADKSTVFYDKLHCPTGFEFHNGGVLVMDQPKMLWLKDTDGDDKADQVVHLLDGWATDDTHHTCGAFEWSHGGLLHMLEGIATSTTLETPWGPHRSLGDGGAYVFDPRTQKIRQFKLPGQANMWCYVFDEWGQGIVGDGTTSNHHWDSPLSGQPYPGRKSLNTVFNQEGMRPALGNEWLVTRQFPDDVQKQFLYACVINMNGMPRFKINDDGAGFKGQRMKKPDGKPDDFIRSADKHFRPGDPQIGPDGALYFVDWANALIGHMQYSQRDPNRDHVRGRVYRMLAKDRPLVKPATQHGKSVAEICEQFREYEWRTRYRARRELHDRPASEVLPAVAAWAEGVQARDPALHDRLLCEALWVQQGHHALDVKLLDRVLKAATPQARAAAVHILADERERVPGALARFQAAAVDPHPRVRLEAVRALSFYPEMPAVSAILAAAQQPRDYWIDYTVNASLGATESVWKQAYQSGELAKTNPAARAALAEVLAGSAAGGMAAPYLKTLLGTEKLPEEVRNKAMTALSMQRGNAAKGREVFMRSCTACHKVGSSIGQDFGPNMEKVGTRLNRVKIVESIIDPNAVVDAKYLATLVELADGRKVSGLLVSETKEKLVIFDGKDKKEIKVADIEQRKALKQSSMPEGLAGAIAPSEFVDLLEYLAGLK